MATAAADKPIPSWINKWLLISGLITIFDGSFCVLRPHSLEGGCLYTVFYAFMAAGLILTDRYYTMWDLHYADATDSFVWAQGLGNIIEAALNLVVVFKLIQSIRLSKFVAITASIMTFWKTVIFCLYSLDVGAGGHTFHWVGELMVNGPALIWIVFPGYAAWVLMQDFLESGAKRPPKNDKAEADGNDVTDSSSPSRGGYNLRRR